MTKADLVELLATRADCSRATSQLMINTRFKSLAEALDAGEKVELRGFGSFRLKVRNARNARNPKTGEKVNVGKKIVPAFRAGRALKSAVNPGTELGTMLR